MSRNKFIVNSFLAFIAIAFGLAVAYGAWRWKVGWDWGYSYRGEVKETIHEMVKPECLKE